MVGTVEASSGTRSIGICNSCTKGAPKTDLYTCTTCKENSATAVDADFLVCCRCIAKTHKGHDYQELDVLSKKASMERCRRFKPTAKLAGRSMRSGSART
ncbi:hypothetical protein AAVH_37809, partial [Aphelenchoides avenae]